MGIICDLQPATTLTHRGCAADSSERCVSLHSQHLGLHWRLPVLQFMVINPTLKLTIP